MNNSNLTITQRHQNLKVRQLYQSQVHRICKEIQLKHNLSQFYQHSHEFHWLLTKQMDQRVAC